MKNLPFLTLFSAFIIFSCSSDESFTEPQINQESEFVASTFSVPASSTTNTNNPYEDTGRAYAAILDFYYAANYPEFGTLSIVDNVETIANSLPDFEILKNNDLYVTIEYEKIEEILEGTYSMENAIIESGLTNKGQIAFGNFISGLQNALKTQSIQIIHNYILEFEDSLLLQENLSSKDFEIIFTITSILRHHNAADKGKDWMLIRTSIISILRGMSENTAKAVLMSSALQVIQDQD